MNKQQQKKTVSKRQRVRNASSGKSVMKSAPVAKAVVAVAPKPKIRMDKNAMYVKHTEYIKDINGSIAFTALSYPINPGLGSLFPWLSVVASRFESYCFTKLRFRFRTMAATSQKGAVVLAVDFDVLDDAPATKVELLSYEDNARAAPWEECAYTCDIKNLQKMKTYFTRVGNAPTASDLKTYDVGQLIVATVAQADTAVVGELHVDYEIKLMTPQLSAAVPSARVTPNSESDTAIFGTSVTEFGADPFSFDTNTLTFKQSGEWLLVFILGGTVLSGISSAVTGTATATVIAATYDTADTAGVIVMRTRGLVDDTIIFDYSGATTLTTVSLRIARYAYSNA